MDIITKITGWFFAGVGIYLQSEETYNLGSYIVHHGAAIFAH